VGGGIAGSVFQGCILLFEKLVVLYIDLQRLNYIYYCQTTVYTARIKTMNSVAQLEKQQVGLRLHKYLIDEIDEFTKEFSVNRTDIITEAIKSYLSAQREKMFYMEFERSCQEAKRMIDGEVVETSLGELINELNANSDS